MMKGNLDNFEQCEKNIKKNQDPTGGNPDYWRDKYAPKKAYKNLPEKKIQTQTAQPGILHQKIYL